MDDSHTPPQPPPPAHPAEPASEPRPEPRSEPPRPPLGAQPQPRVARLNRLVLAVIGIGAILILWIALWVLGRPRRGAEPPERARATSRAVDLSRLERSAARPPAPAAARAPLPPPPSTRRPSRPATRNDPEALRAQRALDASPVVPAFQSPALYAQTRAAGPGAMTTPFADPERPVAGPRSGPGTGAEASTGEPAHRPKPPDRPALRGASRPDAVTVIPDDQLPARHEAFLETARRRQRPTTLPADLTPAAPPYTLYEGTYLPAILTAGIHSDLPGQTTALVRENVYDSRTGRHLLVPSGSRLLGAYDHRVAWGERRVLLAWHRLIFPDGTSLDLRGLPGADLAGEAGVRDRVDNHFVRTFGTALLLSAFSAGAQLSQPQEATGLGQAPSARQIVAAALGQEINRVATQLLRRNLNRPPTLEIRPGKLFFVQLTADLVLPHAYAGTSKRTRPG